MGGEVQLVNDGDGLRRLPLIRRHQLTPLGLLK